MAKIKKEPTEMPFDFKEEWETICRLLKEIMTYDIPLVPML